MQKLQKLWAELLWTAFKYLFPLKECKRDNIKMPPVSDSQRKRTIQHSNLQIYRQRTYWPNKRTAALTLLLWCVCIVWDSRLIDRSPSTGQKGEAPPQRSRGGPTHGWMSEHLCLSNCANFRWQWLVNTWLWLNRRETILCEEYFRLSIQACFVIAKPKGEMDPAPPHPAPLSHCLSLAGILWITTW